MKKIIMFSILLTSINFSENNEGNLGISTNFDNIKLEAIYKKNLTGDEQDLKTYFKSGNSIAFNFTYVIGDVDNTEDETVSVSTFSKRFNNKNSLEKSYLLKSNEGIKSIYNLSKRISNNEYNIKFDKKEITNNKDKNKTLQKLNTYAKELISKYGKINKEDIVLNDIVKKDEIKIIFWEKK